MIDEKGMTAPVASVGADAGQSPNSTNSSITDAGYDFKENMRRYQELSRMYDPSYLHTFSMNDLYEQVFTSRQPLIDGLLYSGTYLLAGAPKVGKSFLVAQIAYHISTGQPLWGYPVRRGGVLYLALEDDQQRLQGRMSRMFGVEGTISTLLSPPGRSGQGWIPSLKTISVNTPVQSSSSSTRFKKSGQFPAKGAAMRVTMKLLDSSNGLPTARDFVSCWCITQGNNRQTISLR